MSPKHTAGGPGRLAIVLLLGLHSAPATAAEAGRAPVEIAIRAIDSKAAARVSYSRDIKPILLNRCLECHNADDRRGQFETTSVAKLLQHGKKAGPGVVPGEPDASAIVQYIRGRKEPQMPKGNPPLPEEELHLIRSWIAAGAKDDTGTTLAAAGQIASANHPTAAELRKIFLSRTNSVELMTKRRALRLARWPRAEGPPRVEGQVFNEIDRFIVAQWRAAGFTDTPEVCGDATFVRRVYLDVIGAIPTVAEAKRFVNDAAPDKRSKLINELLARNELYAGHWMQFWQDALGSATTATQGGIVTRGNFREWLYTNFVSNTAYDMLVARLLDPTMPGFKQPQEAVVNGRAVQTGYIRNDTHTATIQSAAEVAQVFLGTGMKCASCHSHFENTEWPQARFLAFAGLFAPRDLELIRCERKSGEFIATAYPFEIPDAPTGMPADMTGRLHRLALLTTDPANPRFAKTMVNRLWKRFLGLGLFEPADDFRLERPGANPALLDWLADDFMRHGFDLKHTTRLILASRTYQLRYDPPLADRFDVAKPAEPRYWRSPTLRRLTAEQILDSLEVAGAQKLEAQRREFYAKVSTTLTRSLGKPASRTEISTARPDDVAVMQALELLNGEEFQKLVYGSKTLARAAAETNRRPAIEQLYWTALSRPPSAEELALGERFLAGGAGREGLGDLLWACFAGPEFQYIK